MYCPIYNPQIQNLFDFQNRIHIKLHETAPDLFKTDVILDLQLEYIRFIWNKECIVFTNPGEIHEDDEYWKFHGTLIQSDPYESKVINVERWTQLIQKLKASNVSAEGFIKCIHDQEFFDETTVIAFSKMDHNVLDMIEMEFNGCKLCAEWNFTYIDSKKFEHMSHRLEDQTPSHFIANKLHLPFISTKMNLYLDNYLLCQQTTTFWFVIVYRVSVDENIILQISHDSVTLSMQLPITLKNLQLIKALGRLVDIFPWHEQRKFKTEEEYIMDGNDVDEFWWTEDMELSEDGYLTVLNVVDEISKYVDIEISCSGTIYVSRA
eukprot:134061_1